MKKLLTVPVIIFIVIGLAGCSMETTLKQPNATKEIIKIDSIEEAPEFDPFKGLSEDENLPEIENYENCGNEICNRQIKGICIL